MIWDRPEILLPACAILLSALLLVTVGDRFGVVTAFIAAAYGISCACHRACAVLRSTETTGVTVTETRRSARAALGVSSTAFTSAQVTDRG